MKTIEVCPSTLRPGFSAYSPQAIKELFDGVVSWLLHTILSTPASISKVAATWD